MNNSFRHHCGSCFSTTIPLIFLHDLHAGQLGDGIQPYFGWNCLVSRHEPNICSKFNSNHGFNIPVCWSAFHMQYMNSFVLWPCPAELPLSFMVALDIFECPSKWVALGRAAKPRINPQTHLQAKMQVVNGNLAVDNRASELFARSPSLLTRAPLTCSSAGALHSFYCIYHTDTFSLRLTYWQLEPSWTFALTAKQCFQPNWT